MNSVSEKEVFTLSAVSVFAVFSQWGIFSVDVFALGINCVAFGFAVWLILLSVRNHTLSKHDYIWFIPLWMILASMLLFENPWLKNFSLILLPLLTGAIFCMRQTEENEDRQWDGYFLGYLIGRALSPITHISGAVDTLAKVNLLTNKSSIRRVFKSVFVGVLTLIPLAAIVLFLLASVDPNFAQFIEGIYALFWELIDVDIFLKLTLSVFVLIVLLAVSIAWNVSSNPSMVQRDQNGIDDLRVGVVIIGLLIIYSVFLWFQIDYVLVGSLPINFDDTERVVKSGFWQLFVLSVLNVTLYLVVYRRAARTVQNLLKGFVFASGLLLFSGAWRVFLYSYYYGLSYEKFFAVYTCVYALFVFGYLMNSCFSKQSKNIVRSLCLSFVWCYALATLLPIEKIIFRTNVVLSQKEDSRVNLHHLQFLSVDVARDVIREVRHGNLNGGRWWSWLFKVKARECSRPWYEANLSRVINCHSLDYADDKSPKRLIE